MRLKNLEKITALTLCLMILLAGCSRSVDLNPEEVKVDRIYHYTCDGKEGIFLLMNAPVYTSGYGCKYKYDKKTIRLQYYHDADGEKTENNAGEGYAYWHDLEDETKLLVNGKEVWNAENSTATEQVPDYVKAATRQKLSISYDVANMQVNAWDSSGVVMSWDLDGKLLYEKDKSYLNDPYWEK